MVQIEVFDCSPLPLNPPIPVTFSINEDFPIYDYPNNKIIYLFVNISGF